MTRFSSKKVDLSKVSLPSTNPFFKIFQTSQQLFKMKFLSSSPSKNILTITLITVVIVLSLLLVALTDKKSSSVSAQQYQHQQLSNKEYNNNNDENNEQQEQQRIYSQALATRSIPSQDLQSLPVSRLRRFLGERGADCDGCLEKHDLVERAVEVMTWPTREDAVATELSLEQDLMGPLVNDLSIPVGDDKSSFQDQYDDETLTESPSARSSVKPLSDEEVVNLLEIYRMRVLIAEGVARCGPRHLNGTQYCQPTQAIISRETE